MCAEKHYLIIGCNREKVFFKDGNISFKSLIGY